MARFTLSSLFTRWMPSSERPKHKGCYRTREKPMPHGWFNELA